MRKIFNLILPAPPPATVGQQFDRTYQKSLKLCEGYRIALTFGFLLSFVSVTVAIVLALNDPLRHVPLAVHLVTWAIASAIIFAIMIFKVIANAWSKGWLLHARGGLGQPPVARRHENIVPAAEVL